MSSEILTITFNDYPHPHTGKSDSVYELEGVKPTMSVRLAAIPWLTFHVYDVGD